ncbi:hypothetical protein BDP27DRAFT_1313546 [Rhodocollybia butyracea]|uniref:BOD1/SHG1 domain-containing protein n=1 Tax=Rhodocollybia butyracea TaxID=206335 RepID=A0A9P5UFQ6_9AGAR|nr:hypothetical protein BDP27DRAFT_1313546 [Rhodocollybia butyracea]
MPATNPSDLVEQFKRSGEFDRLRRELFAEFQKGDHIPTFNKKTEDVVKQRFASMKARPFMNSRFDKTEGNIRTELMQEIQRYPYVETTVNDLAIFSDKNFNDDLRKSHDPKNDEKDPNMKDSALSSNGRPSTPSFPQISTPTTAPPEGPTPSIAQIEAPSPSLSLSPPDPPHGDKISPASISRPPTRQGSSALPSLSPSPAPSPSAAKLKSIAVPMTTQVPDDTSMHHDEDENMNVNARKTETTGSITTGEENPDTVMEELPA